MRERELYRVLVKGNGYIDLVGIGHNDRGEMTIEGEESKQSALSEAEANLRAESLREIGFEVEIVKYM